MASGAYIAKQVIEDELQSQIDAVKAELEAMASRAQGRTAKAELEAYEKLSPKLQTIQRKLQQLEKSSGSRWEQTKADLEVLITDFKESVKEIASAGEAN